MKIGDKLTHEGIEAVLVEGADCKQCCFDGLDCANNGLMLKCLAYLADHDDGIFKQIEEDKQ